MTRYPLPRVTSPPLSMAMPFDLRARLETLESNMTSLLTGLTNRVSSLETSVASISHKVARLEGDTEDRDVPMEYKQFNFNFSLCSIERKI